MKIKTSLILSFYNRIDYLKLVLAGFRRQIFRDFEIIIADDGSAPEVINQIELFSRSLPWRVVHIWQEDRGFRKNKILNRAIEASESDYLIFTDADCIPHSNFINEHFLNRQKKFCLTGRRVNLSEKFTRLLTEEKVTKGCLEKLLPLIKDGIFGNSIDVEKGFYIKNKFIRKLLNKKQRGLLGCNFSVFKEDIMNVNGFDERYEAPSIGEDTDLQFRLELNGVKVKSLNNIAVQYHLYHKIQPRAEENLRLFEEIKKSKTAFTKFGINKIIPE